MQRVTIVGLGLIGGSIGLGLQRWSKENSKSGQALEITGFDLDITQQQYAQKIHAINRAEWELSKAVRGADIVILATPVVAMKDLFQDIAPVLKPGAVVTDVGSTKADVLEWAAEYLPSSVHFVGGHPMAGKSESIEGADPDLFKGATWCVCPAVTASDEAIRNVLGMIAALGAEAFFLDPHEHDAYVAGVSHLPFVVSAAIMNATSGDTSWRDMKTLTATGFRDITRLASGSPAMHRDILLTNRAAVSRWITTMIGELEKVRASLNSENASEELLKYFERARDARADWSTQTGREGELVQDTAEELSSAGLGSQMGRLFFGGMFNRRRSQFDRIGRPESDGRRDSAQNGRRDA